MTDIVNPEQSVPFVRPRSAVYIAVSDELYRIVRDLRTLEETLPDFDPAAPSFALLFFPLLLELELLFPVLFFVLLLLLDVSATSTTGDVLDRLFKTILNIHVVTGQVCILIIDLDLDPAVLLIRDKGIAHCWRSVCRSKSSYSAPSGH